MTKDLINLLDGVCSVFIKIFNVIRNKEGYNPTWENELYHVAGPAILSHMYSSLKYYGILHNLGTFISLVATLFFIPISTQSLKHHFIIQAMSPYDLLSMKREICLFSGF